jgi:2'-5' RNA ligase
MKSVRLFAAVALQSSFEEKFDFLVEQAAAVPSEVRWVKPDCFHLTLKFFGEMSEEKLPLVADFLAKTAVRHGAFSLELGGLGAFPNFKNPRVLFVPVESSGGPLKELAADIEKTARIFGLNPEENSFKAHVTLGRVKSNSGLEAVLEKLKTLTVVPLGTMPVESFFLYQSHLTAEGPVYTRLREFFLMK